MARSFSITPVRILGLKDGQSWYDSRNYPVHFFPPEDVVLIEDVVVNFPDFVHANAYGFVAGDTGGGTIRQSCSSYVTIPFQDWGPADQPGISNNLSDAVIGTIPGDADVVLIRINGIRTNPPDQINGNSVPTGFEEGQWVQADGGTMLIEYLFPIVRMIWIRFAATLNLDGTRNVILTRKQSIRKTLFSFWTAGNSSSSIGWTFGGTNGRYGHIVKLIEAKGPAIAPGGLVTFRRGDGGQCSLTDTSDYASSFTMDIEITPGKSNIDNENTGGSSGIGGTRMDLTDFAEVQGASTSHTYNGKFIGEVPSTLETRTLFVVAKGHISLQSASRTINGVTYNGVAMTEVVKQTTYLDKTGSNDPSTVVGIWRIDSPAVDGETANFVVSFSASFWYSDIDIYAVYNLPSTTPIETLKSGNGDVTHSLDTVPYGEVIGGVLGMGGGVQSLAVTGPQNIVLENVTVTSPNTVQGKRVRGYQQGNLPNPLSIAITDGMENTANAWASFQGRPGRSYGFTDTFIYEASFTSLTVPGMSIGDVPETGNTRHVIAVITIAGSSTSFDVSSPVTIGGITATQRAKYRLPGSTRSYMSMVYIAEVPTGITADIIIPTTGGTGAQAIVDVYAAYNLLSTVPTDTAGYNALGPSFSDTLNSNPFGFSIGGGLCSGTVTVTGLDNVITEIATANGGQYRWLAWKQTDSANTVGVTTGANTLTGVWASFA